MQSFIFLSLLIIMLSIMGLFRPWGHSDVSLGIIFYEFEHFHKISIYCMTKKVVVQFSCKLADLIESYSFLYIGVNSGFEKGNCLFDLNDVTIENFKLLYLENYTCKWYPGFFVRHYFWCSMWWTKNIFYGFCHWSSPLTNCHHVWRNVWSLSHPDVLCWPFHFP